MGQSKKVKQIQDFIFNDEVQNILSQINNNLMDFNILEITGMGTQEIKHSNTLAWLFGANEHNLGYLILEDFLKKVLEVNKNFENRDYLQEYIYLAKNKKDIQIFREQDNIDLLLLDKANQIVITIENKVFAEERDDGEDGGQLKKYEDIVKEKYKNYKHYFLYLTINLDNPARENWLKANHQMVTDTLESIINTKDLSTKTEIVFLSYIDLLKRSAIVEDRKLQELCEKIWLNEEYSNALEVLIDYRVTPLNTIFRKLQKMYDFDESYINLPLKGIEKLYKKFGLDWEDSESIFDIILAYSGGKNEKIELYYYYPELSSQKNSKLMEICKKVSPKLNKEYTTILKINREYIKNRDINDVTEEIIHA